MTTLSEYLTRLKKQGTESELLTTRVMLLMFGLCVLLCVTTFKSIFIAGYMYNYVDVRAEISKRNRVSSHKKKKKKDVVLCFIAVHENVRSFCCMHFKVKKGAQE